MQSVWVGGGDVQKHTQHPFMSQSSIYKSLSLSLISPWTFHILVQQLRSLTLLLLFVCVFPHSAEIDQKLLEIMKQTGYLKIDGQVRCAHRDAC